MLHVLNWKQNMVEEKKMVGKLYADCGFKLFGNMFQGFGTSHSNFVDVISMSPRWSIQAFLMDAKYRGKKSHFLLQNLKFQSTKTVCELAIGYGSLPVCVDTPWYDTWYSLGPCLTMNFQTSICACIFRIYIRLISKFRQKNSRDLWRYFRKDESKQFKWLTKAAFFPLIGCLAFRLLSGLMKWS